MDAHHHDQQHQDDMHHDHSHGADHHDPHGHHDFVPEPEPEVPHIIDTKTWALAGLRSANQISEPDERGLDQQMIFFLIWFIEMLVIVSVYVYLI